MKKFVKGCLILAAVCAVLGGVACVTGLVLGAGTGELQQAFRESGLKKLDLGNRFRRFRRIF